MPWLLAERTDAKTSHGFNDLAGPIGNAALDEMREQITKDLASPAQDAKQTPSNE